MEFTLKGIMILPILFFDFSNANCRFLDCASLCPVVGDNLSLALHNTLGCVLNNTFVTVFAFGELIESRLTSHQDFISLEIQSASFEEICFGCIVVASWRESSIHAT